MSGDVAMFDDELKSLEDQIRNNLRQMEQLTGDARQTKFNRASELLKMAQKNFHHFKVEIRQLDSGEQAVYEKKSQVHNQTINQLKEELTTRRYESTSVNGGAGGAGGNGAGGDSYGAVDDGKGKARETRDRIVNTQAAAKAALTRIETTVEETRAVGDEAADRLAQQTEQMKRMNDKLDKLDSEVDRAKTELNMFIRRMMTDKIILCFILLIIIAVIVIVVIKVKDPGADPFSSPTSTPTPATPQPPSTPQPTPPPTPSTTPAATLAAAAARQLVQRFVKA